MSRPTNIISAFPLSYFSLFSYNKEHLFPPTAMPLYEYQCPSCQLIIEKLQSSFNPLTILCKECETKDQKKVEMKKILSRTGFSLKGDGWYKDHYGLKPSTSKTQQG
jgi:putative FmdB family regulatory protein